MAEQADADGGSGAGLLAPEVGEGEEVKPVELTPEEFETFSLKKRQNDEHYYATVRKWGSVAFNAMFWPSMMALLNIIAGKWYASAPHVVSVCLLFAVAWAS